MRGTVQNALRLFTRVMRPLALRSAGREGTATSVVRHVGRRSGRARDGRLGHFACVPDEVRPGDVVTTTVTYGAPHHLVADGPPLARRRTAAGDASAAGRVPVTPGVLLGMPTVRR